VTLVVGVLDPTNGRVEFANAGHVPPLVVSSTGVEALRSTDLVVGLFPNAQYRNQTIELKPGDSLVLFTDGVTEAENSLEEQLGLAPVADALRSLHCENAARMLSEIEEHVNRHIGDAPAGDDVTMLALTRCA
jgi:sigma-B regulation protein RsbU (phosphoserine phosphatase)